MSAYFQFCLISLLPLLAIVAAAKDISSYIIPNWISLGLMAAFFMLAATAGVTLPVLGSHLLVGVVALFIGMGLFALGWIGGGDAKLASATALWFGWEPLFDYGFTASIIGGALTLVVVELHRRELPKSLMSIGFIAKLADKQGRVPYGIALALSGLLIYPHSPLWERLGSL